MTHSGRLADQHNAFFPEEHVRTNKCRVLTPGQQKLVYLFRTGAFGDDFRHGRGRPALDAGCGAGYNTVTLDQLGWTASAFDITPELTANALRNIQAYGARAEVRCGTNQAIPFADGAFQMLLSMNTIHYVQSREELAEAFAEFARVLTPGGRIYLTTNHPENWIFQNGEPAGENLMRVRQDGDYRNGLVLYRFANENALRELAEAQFQDVRLGTDVNEYFNKTTRNYVLTGVRP